MATLNSPVSIVVKSAAETSGTIEEAVAWGEEGTYSQLCHGKPVADGDLSAAAGPTLREGLPSATGGRACVG